MHFLYFAVNRVSAFYVLSHLLLYYRHRHAHTVWPRLARSHITTELSNSKHPSVQIIVLSRLFKRTSVCWHQHTCPKKTTWEFIKWKWDLTGVIYTNHQCFMYRELFWTFNTTGISVSQIDPWLASPANAQSPTGIAMATDYVLVKGAPWFGHYTGVEGQYCQPQ